METYGFFFKIFKSFKLLSFWAFKLLKRRMVKLNKIGEYSRILTNVSTRTRTRTKQKVDPGHVARSDNAGKIAYDTSKATCNVGLDGKT
jgi:hypothetical protein